MARLSLYNGLLRDSSSAVVTSSHESSFDSCGRNHNSSCAEAELNASSLLLHQRPIPCWFPQLIIYLDPQSQSCGWICLWRSPIHQGRETSSWHLKKNKEGAFVNPRMFWCVLAWGKLGQRSNLRVSRVCEDLINDTSPSRSDVWQDVNA